MYKRGFTDSMCQDLSTFDSFMALSSSDFTPQASLPKLRPGETHDRSLLAKVAFTQATVRCNQFEKVAAVALTNPNFPFWKYLGALISHVADTMPAIDTLGTTPLPLMTIPNLSDLIPPPEPDRNIERNRSRDANNKDEPQSAWRRAYRDRGDRGARGDE